MVIDDQLYKSYRPIHESNHVTIERNRVVWKMMMFCIMSAYLFD